ncbi:hypothetical protein CO611_09445 [Lysobacteraceae bacterium NML03-0222]|nr:hypothetical protein CO611_09445 [Xanthomonadaceae bacterium NML03-0222]
MKKAFLGLSLSVLAAMPLAGMAQQQRAAPQANAATALPEADANSMIVGALQVLQLVDNNQAGEVWEGSSATAKAVVTREAFVRQIQVARSSLGQVQSRTWFSVIRQRVDAAGAAGGTPVGDYISVRFATRFSSGSNLIELVSFRRDSDAWRVAGYAFERAQ